MTNRITKSINFSPLKSKNVECSFTGVKITSDGGISFLREVDKKLHLTKQIASVIPDKRNPYYKKHTVLQMVRQRVYGLAFGY